MKKMIRKDCIRLSNSNGGSKFATGLLLSMHTESDFFPNVEMRYKTHFM